MKPVSNADRAMLAFENAAKAWHAKEHPGCDFWSLSWELLDDREVCRCGECDKEWITPTTDEERAERRRHAETLALVKRVSGDAAKRMRARLADTLARAASGQ